MSLQLRDLGFRMERLKTGTPPRLHKDSLDYSKMIVQPGEEPPPFFGWRCRRRPDCSTWNNPVPEPVRWPVTGQMFHVEQSAAVRALGPGIQPDPMLADAYQRKNHRHHFGESGEFRALWRADRRNRRPVLSVHRGQGGQVSRPTADHHVFVEPEGRGVLEMYPNGTSNSLPVEVQQEMIHSIPGLERAEFLAPGYAIEYDFFDPTQLHPHPGDQAGGGALFCGAGQRHHRLRRGGRARVYGWRQFFAASTCAGTDYVDAARGLHRRDDRRFGDQGNERAVPDVHVAGGASAAVAAGQRGVPPGRRMRSIWASCRPSGCAKSGPWKKPSPRKSGA